ncbi:MAG: hypothetical protein CMH13_05435 [Martelella sp.]|uniref:DUF2093 domain-containing protein n=1 Tax=unclassified Martelella TaxID=2629616 RepID=UPI000C3A9BDF|nr:DUF2093 domain-containing protein [Martelella sp.]MAU19955.1 hypothetical protein [Martelella sp.]
MNIFDGSGKGAARIRYLDANFEVVTPGSYVVCAVTGKHIPLEELRYWSVARQEAYVDAEASFEAEKRAGALPTDKP